jgi:hypothetical protein
MRCSPSRLRREQEGATDVIRYSLACVGEHGFEAWFSDSAAYDAQRKKKLVECPVCGSTNVHKQIMAPMVRSSDKAVPPEVVAAKVAAEVRAHIEKTHDYVGDRFAEEARSMYYGEIAHRPVWGEVTPDVAQELLEEGVPAMPLPKPFAPEPPKSKRRAN